LSSAVDPHHIAEMFAGFGPVSVRRMFGGAGVFADGLMIGLVSDGVIFLKADETDIPRFEHEGMRAFSYRRKDRMQTINSFWRMPERLYDEPDELAEWAARAMAGARRLDSHSGRRTKASTRGGEIGSARPDAKARARPRSKTRAGTRAKPRSNSRPRR
jgi:DNA transformation protein and related proteins